MALTLASGLSQPMTGSSRLASAALTSHACRCPLAVSLRKRHTSRYYRFSRTATAQPTLTLLLELAPTRLAGQPVTNMPSALPPVLVLSSHARGALACASYSPPHNYSACPKCRRLHASACAIPLLTIPFLVRANLLSVSKCVRPHPCELDESLRASIHDCEGGRISHTTQKGAIALLFALYPLSFLAEASVLLASRLEIRAPSRPLQLSHTACRSGNYTRRPKAFFSFSKNTAARKGGIHR
jgi:hypothetical protein